MPDLAVRHGPGRIAERGQRETSRHWQEKLAACIQKNHSGHEPGESVASGPGMAAGDAPALIAGDVQTLSARYAHLPRHPNLSQYLYP